MLTGPPGEWLSTKTPLFKTAENPDSQGGSYIVRYDGEIYWTNIAGSALES